MKLQYSLAALGLGLCLFTHTTFAADGPPNWKVFAAGSTEPAGDGSGLDLLTSRAQSARPVGCSHRNARTPDC